MSAEDAAVVPLSAAYPAVNTNYYLTVNPNTLSAAYPAVN